MKPVAAGCELINGEWVNGDVQKLTAASNVKAPRELVNPYCFNEPIAPHLAANMAGIEINIDKIKQAYQLLSNMADVVIVEGAGGLLVPLNEKESLADLAEALSLPIFLVVGMKLGCINHSLLTAEAIKARGLTLHGWVANHIDPNMAMRKENIETITKQLRLAPMFESRWVK
jgi:dethiobiotin synthetase